MPLVSLDQLKAELGITGTTQDAELLRLIAAIDSRIETYLGYPVSGQSVTEYLDGHGDSDISLSRPFVTTIESVALENDQSYSQTGGFPPSSILTLGTDYVVQQTPTLKRTTLIRLGANWPIRRRFDPSRLASRLVPARGIIRVIYNVGDFPTAISHAAYAECKSAWAMRLNGVGMMQSQSFDGFSVSLNPVSGSGASSSFLSPLSEISLRPFRLAPIARW
jgi:hypothetical protein